MITQEVKNSFIYETMNGEFTATNPTEFDQVIPGGPWKTKEEAEVFLNQVEYDLK